MAISISNSLFMRTRLESLNLAQNGLGFKTGQFILNYVTSCCTPENRGKLALKKVCLSFNLMSETLVDRVTQALQTLEGNRVSVKKREEVAQTRNSVSPQRISYNTDLVTPKKRSESSCRPTSTSSHKSIEVHKEHSMFSSFVRHT